MSILLFDFDKKQNFLPLTYTRAICDLYAGAMTLRQWWHKITRQPVYVLTQPYLSDKYEACPPSPEYIYINSASIPGEDLWEAAQALSFDEILFDNNNIPLAFKSHENYQLQSNFKIKRRENRLFDTDVLQYPFQLTQQNKKFFELQQHFFENVEKTEHVTATNLLINSQQIFIEAGCTITGCIINASEGPVYISRNCLVMEGALLRGPLFLGESTVVKMGAKIYGATSIGKKCTVGGEIKNIIMQDYSNKAHDGYLGDSLIGSWCNLGAGTSCSNVKNTGGEIEYLNFASGEKIAAGKKLGTIMGDYVRTAINTSINSGSSIGLCCSVHGEKSICKITPNFSWGNEGKKSYRLADALAHMSNWMSFKNESLSPADKEIVQHLYGG